MKMRNFMKKSSLALLLAVLVLLTCILVGTAITASADDTATEPEHEATLYAEDGITVIKTGTFYEVMNYQQGASGNTTNYKVKLHKDVVLTAAWVVKNVAEIDGAGHTIYIADAINVEDTTYFFSITHKGTTVFKNINFVGQSKAWWEGGKKVEDMKAFGVADKTKGAGGAIYVGSADRHFEMQNCTMTAFRTNGQASCIFYNYAGATATYDGNCGVYLKDTVIVGNYAVGATWGGSSSAIKLPVYANVYGNKLHVSGNTIVKDNYDKFGDASNIYVYNSNSGANGPIESSVLFVEDDFTGTVGVMLLGGMASSSKLRGCVFFEGESYDTANRQGVVFANNGYATTGGDWISPQSTNSYRNFVNDDSTTPCGCFASANIATNWSTLTDTTKLTVMDSTGEKEIFSGDFLIQNGAILSAWATWTDSTYGTVSKTHANGVDYIATLSSGIVPVFASKDNGATWEFHEKLTNTVLTKDYTNVEVLGDYVIDRILTFAEGSAVVVDFNNFTVTRANGQYYFYCVGTSADSLSFTVKNAKFVGDANDSTAYNLFLLLNTHANPNGMSAASPAVTFDNCTFTNFVTNGSGNDTDTKGRAAVIGAGGRSKVILKDVTMTGCAGTKGAVYVYGSAGSATGVKNDPEMPAIYLEGNTQIYNDTTKSETRNMVHIWQNYAALGVSGTFTGTVEVSPRTTGDNKPTYGQSNSESNACDDAKARCYVAEGAEVKGRIFATGTNYFAYNNNGTLCWMSPGGTLDTTNVVPLSYDEETNTLSGAAWYYNDGKKDVATTVAVPGQYVYFIKEVDADAVINNGSTLVYGDLKTVLEGAAADQTVEILRDVTGVQNITISNAITVDGNGKTLTWAIVDADNLTEAENFMIKAAADGIVYKDIVFHGGAAEKGVWERSLAPYDSVMLPHEAAISFEGCTIRGARIEYTQSNAEIGAIFGSGYKALTLIDTTIIDNIIKFSEAHGGTDAVDSYPHLITQRSNTAITKISGKMVFNENYRIVADGKVYQDNLFGSTKRLLVGELTAGSEVHTVAAQPFTPELNAEGKPYNNSGYLYTDNLTAIEATTEDDVVTITGSSYYQSYLHYTGTQIDQLAANQISMSDMYAQGEITTDKFQLYYKSTVKADYYGTDVVIKINGNEVSRKNLSEHKAPAASVFTFDDVAVGMAELTDAIEIELQDKETKAVLASKSTMAKEYADGLIAATEGVTTAQKKAVASLLQYGAMVQTYFGYHTDELAMTADDLTAWKEANIITDVATNSIDISGEKVYATASGTQPEGITVGGAGLTMENEMSLRLYFSLGEGKALTDYSFTIDGVPVTPEESGSRYYIEASNIGTADLAKYVAFAITYGETTYTVNASPMTYVLAVTKNDAQPDNLKNVCEALYYYYKAVAECFPSVIDATGFVIVGTQLVKSIDTETGYSVPHGVSE